MPAIDSSHVPAFITSSSIQEQVSNLIPWLTKRRGVSGGGGGAKSGGSSSSSSGSSGSSSSGSKGSPPAYSGGSAPPPYSVSGGSSISGLGTKSTTSGSLGSAQKAGVYGSSPASAGYGRSYGRYGYGPGLLLPVYGFWPIYAYHGRSVNDTTRPGGDLTSAGFTAPDDAEHTYVVYGDQQSVSALIPALNLNCNANNASAPADLSANTTLESYRDDSLELYRFPNVTTTTAVNATFEGCLNSTIGDNLLVASAALATAAPLVLAGLVAMATGWGLA